MKLLQGKRVPNAVQNFLKLVQYIVTHTLTPRLVQYLAYPIQCHESLVDEFDRLLKLKGKLLGTTLHIHCCLLSAFLLFGVGLRLGLALGSLLGVRLVLAAFIHILIYSNLYFIFNCQGIIIANKMINGVNISELTDVSLTRVSHMHKLRHIVNSDPSNFSVMSQSLCRGIRSNKSIHQQWRRHQQRKFRVQIERSNQIYSRKLQSIMMGKSKYSFKERDSPSVSKSHHFYTRQRRQHEIDIRNPEIARRIINVKGDLNLSRSHGDFEKSQVIVHRLEKFPIVKRMNELSEKRFMRERRHLTEVEIPLQLQTPRDKFYSVKQ